MCTTSMPKTFSMHAGHYPLYCPTKRHDNEEEDLKLWTSPSKNALQSHWYGVIRRSKPSNVSNLN